MKMKVKVQQLLSINENPHNDVYSLLVLDPQSYLAEDHS